MRLRRWKDSILFEPGALGQWLRRREAKAVCTLTRSGVTARSPSQGVSMLAAFWKDFWEQHARTSPASDVIVRG